LSKNAVELAHGRGNSLTSTGDTLVGGLDFDGPEEKIETEIVSMESGVDADTAGKLVQIAHRARNLKGHALDEGLSSRLFVYSGQLIGKGVEPPVHDYGNAVDGRSGYARHAYRSGTDIFLGSRLRVIVKSGV